jgi:hypothetical protein
VLGCYTNDERREWLEAILNAKLPTKQQVCCLMVILMQVYGCLVLCCETAAKDVSFGRGYECLHHTRNVLSAL